VGPQPCCSCCLCGVGCGKLLTCCEGRPSQVALPCGMAAGISFGFWVTPATRSSQNCMPTCYSDLGGGAGAHSATGAGMGDMFLPMWLG
jgi:hypothetical protein